VGVSSAVVRASASTTAKESYKNNAVTRSCASTTTGRSGSCIFNDCLGCMPLHQPLFPRMSWYITLHGKSYHLPYSNLIPQHPVPLASTSLAARLWPPIPFSRTVPSILGNSFVFLILFCRSVTHKSRIFQPHQKREQVMRRVEHL
jgi:hypothetical protein